MKVRTGFISNSSSSSFVLDKRRMTEEQIEAVHDHMEYASEHFPGQFYTGDFSAVWDVEDDGDIITVFTWLDNFDMREFLSWICIGKEAILKEGS